MELGMSCTPKTLNLLDNLALHCPGPTETVFCPSPDGEMAPCESNPLCAAANYNAQRQTSDRHTLEIPNVGLLEKRS